MRRPSFTMKRTRGFISIPVIGSAILAASAWGASWTEYTSGQYRIMSNGGDRAAKQKLAQLDQLRTTLGYYLGKDELSVIWPIEIVLFSNQREYAPHSLPQPLVEGPDSVIAAWTADMPLPHDLLRDIARQFIEANAGRMPQAIDQALCDLMATVDVAKKGMTIGTAPAAGELPELRMLAWAKVDMLATRPEYSGKLRVYLNNLQQGGEEELASRNALGLTPAEFNKRVADYLQEGNFSAVMPAGPPINPDRDFDSKKLTDADVKAMFAALEAQGKDFPEDSPRWLLMHGKRDDLEQAAKANPKWAAPHAALAELHADPEGRAKEWALATSLEPRNAEYWMELAYAQEDGGKYDDAAKSWKLAERNSATADQQVRMHKERMSLEERRTRYTLEAKQHNKQVAADDLEQVRKAAEARIRAAEDAANKRNGSGKSSTPAVPWWSDQDGQKLSGSLTNVECLKSGSLRLTVQPEGGAIVKLMILDVNNLAVKGADRAQFSCGVQKPAKQINLVHDGMADAAQGTAGNVRTVELP